ncbi:MAG: hypothetical protein NVS3B17_10830 [Vulcanimicrobiaceae bacterium]
MAYLAEISRRNPTCFLFLVDRSASMEDPFGNGKRKCDGVAETLNRLLYELAIKCAKEDGIRNYYDVGVIGYGETVGSAFVGQLADRLLIPIAEVAAHPVRIEERPRPGAVAGEGKPIRIPIWFDAVAFGPTPMVEAFGLATSVLEAWTREHHDAYPPTIVNVTDGESTDGDPSPAMHAITHLCTSDGNALLFNVHISGDPHARPMRFPSVPDDLPDAHARLLHYGASPLTPFMRATARNMDLPVADGAKAFVMNADLLVLAQALDIGTRASNPLR